VDLDAVGAGESEGRVMSWQKELEGKFVWCPRTGLVGVVKKAWEEKSYVDFNRRVVPHPVIEFEDGSSAVARDEDQRSFQPMSKNAALLYELSTKVTSDTVRLLADHARGYGLDARTSATIISAVVMRQGRVLKALADRRDDEPQAPTDPAAPAAPAAPVP
jgi:hypothetical protein